MNTTAAITQATRSQPVTISLTDVKKYFGPTRALDGVSLEVRAGEIHAIVGGNGSGKSTLAKVVSGILPIDSGAYSVLGESPSTPAESHDLGIATVFQEVLVADECSVVDNLFMGADELFRNSIPFIEKVDRAEKIMEELAGEYVDPHQLVGTLPLSLKQWITIGRAMLIDPKVLILDESSAALDLDSTTRLFDKMREMRDRGVSILIVTHRIAELIEISDKATVLRDGRDVGVLSRSEITEDNLLGLMTGDDPGKLSHNLQPVKPEYHDVAMRADELAVWADGGSFDFELLKGEIVGIAGLDGQGQSEFVRTLAGVDAPLAGTITVFSEDGKPQLVDSLASAQESRVSYISGDRKTEGIFASLSIFENMMMPLYRLRTIGRKIGIIDLTVLRAAFTRESENLLIKYGDRGDRITSLSGGNQQKVLIGRGFALRPKIMILNDPTRGIDGKAKAELYKHLRAFAEKGNAVVYMSSELEEFPGFASRVLVFRHGNIFDAFDGNTLDNHKVLEAMFGQTDGSGLTEGFDLVREESASVVHSPLNAPIAEMPASVQDSPTVEIANETSVEKAEPKPIRIVEFGSDGQVISGEARN
mgnify:CR=1 FL=1